MEIEKEGDAPKDPEPVGRSLEAYRQSSAFWLPGLSSY